VPTAGFWTEWTRRTARAVVDVRHLLWFRTLQVRRSRAGRWIALVFVAVTLAVAVVPALMPGAGGTGDAFDLVLLLPSALAGFLLLAMVSAVASGGGRELISRDPAQVHPISPTTDHLGALLLAPLNISWLLQAWTLLGVTAYGRGIALLAPAQLVLVAWILAATAMAQVVAWALEGVRRTEHGIAVVRALAVVGLGGALLLQMNGDLVPLLDQVPTTPIVAGMFSGWSWQWAVALLKVLGLLVVAVVVGAVPAHLAARRSPRDELRVETGSYRARPQPRSVLAGLVRTDRASVWRAVPMRRGLAVLAVGPGLVAVIGGLPWGSLIVLPGLVASGGALLYGVNAWCLDARGALWRESLPVPPGAVFAARAYVLAEFLLAASMLTVVLAATRAGVPAPSELTALIATQVVVTVQVVGGALRWSAQRPYAVDLRSARATPAPPLTMVGYSTRLALSTTVTGLVFSAFAKLPGWHLSLVVAIPFLCWSLARLLRTATAWTDPVDRARVVMAVAA
jgi:hypothetical protein